MRLSSIYAVAEAAAHHPNNPNVKQARAAEQQSKAKQASGGATAASAGEAEKQQKDAAKRQQEITKPNQRELQQRKQLLAKLAQQRSWDPSNKQFDQLCGQLISGKPQ